MRFDFADYPCLVYAQDGASFSFEWGALLLGLGLAPETAALLGVDPARGLKDGDEYLSYRRRAGTVEDQAIGRCSTAHLIEVERQSAATPDRIAPPNAVDVLYSVLSNDDPAATEIFRGFGLTKNKVARFIDQTYRRATKLYRPSMWEEDAQTVFEDSDRLCRHDVFVSHNSHDGSHELRDHLAALGLSAWHDGYADINDANTYSMIRDAICASRTICVHVHEHFRDSDWVRAEYQYGFEFERRHPELTRVVVARRAGGRVPPLLARAPAFDLETDIERLALFLRRANSAALAGRHWTGAETLTQVFAAEPERADRLDLSRAEHTTLRLRELKAKGGVQWGAFERGLAFLPMTTMGVVDGAEPEDVNPPESLRFQALESVRLMEEALADQAGTKAYWSKTPLTLNHECIYFLARAYRFALMRQDEELIARLRPLLPAFCDAVRTSLSDADRLLLKRSFSMMDFVYRTRVARGGLFRKKESFAIKGLRNAVDGLTLRMDIHALLRGETREQFIGHHPRVKEVIAKRRKEKRRVDKYLRTQRAFRRP
jgi:hypothetical protein